MEVNFLDFLFLYIFWTGFRRSLEPETPIGTEQKKKKKKKSPEKSSFPQPKDHERARTARWKIFDNHPTPAKYHKETEVPPYSCQHRPGGEPKTSIFTQQ